MSPLYLHCYRYFCVYMWVIQFTEITREELRLKQCWKARVLRQKLRRNQMNARFNFVRWLHQFAVKL